MSLSNNNEVDVIEAFTFTSDLLYRSLPLPLDI